MSIFSTRLREAMKLRGMSQSRLAHDAGTNEANISRYVNAKHDPGVLNILPGIAKTLNISADYLIGLIDYPEPLSDDKTLLLKAYSRMNESDKAALWAILEKYNDISEIEELG